MSPKKIQNQIRVCHISTAHLPSDVRIFRRECRSLAEAGYEVHLVIKTKKQSTKKPFIKDGIHIHPLHSAKSRIFRMFFTPWLAMIKALRINASIYHYHDPELIFIGFILRWILGKKVVFDIHESVPRQLLEKSYLPKFTRKTVSLCYRFLEHVLTPGQSLIVANKNSVSDYSSKTYLVQNYPVLNKTIIAQTDDIRQRSDVPQLVYLGNVSKIRGVMVYIELANELVKRGHNFQMTLIGQFAEEFGKEMKSKIETLNLQNIVLVTDYMDWLEALKLVSKATIGMCLLMPIPNYTTCLATKIIEYMMCGTPVLASNFDVWRPYVEGERTGMMADPTNIDEVVDVCERMLSNPDELAAMGKRGIEAVRLKYNWSTEAKELLKCYNDLLNK